MLIETQTLPMNSGNNFPWAATIVIIVLFAGVGYMAYSSTKSNSITELKNNTNEGSSANNS